LFGHIMKLVAASAGLVNQIETHERS